MPSFFRHASQRGIRASTTLCRTRTIYTSKFTNTSIPGSSVNPDEIDHFSKLSSEWWDEQGEFTFLHKMNPVRMRFITEKLLEVVQDETPELNIEKGDVLKDLDVLDVGCGGGLLSEVRFLATTMLLWNTYRYLLRAWREWVLIPSELTRRNPTLPLLLCTLRQTQHFRQPLRSLGSTT